MANSKKKRWKIWGTLAGVGAAIWYLARPKKRKPRPTTSAPGPSTTGLPPPEANYRPASDQRQCGNCGHGRPIITPPSGIRSNPVASEAPKVRCELWDVDVHANFVCDRWISGQGPDITL